MKKLSGIVLALILTLSITAPASANQEGPVLPEQACITVSAYYPGALSYFPEVLVSGGTDIDGTYPGWCLDADRNIYPDFKYCMTSVYSSYGTLPDGLVEQPGNMDQLNWVLNQGYTGQPSPSGGVYTYGDVQAAVWMIVDDGIPYNTISLEPWSQERADEIVASAYAGGEGYQPGCGDSLWIIIAPVYGQAVIIPLEIDCPVECGECEGGITSLTLQYNGAAPVDVTVTKKKGDDILFHDAEVNPGELFTVTNPADKHGKLGPEIKIFVNGEEYTRIHTSCSQPIGIGMVFGDFEIAGGESKDGGELCPLPPVVEGECAECKGGVTELILQYNGAAPVDVTVMKKKGNDILFHDAEVNPGELFTVTNPADKHGKLGPEIKIFVNGEEYTRVHTSCSQPIGIGMVFGDFEIAGGESKDGGVLAIIPE